MSQKLIVIFHVQETRKHKIEILFKLPIVDDEYKVKQNFEVKKEYEIRDGRN